MNKLIAFLILCVVVVNAFDHRQEFTSYMRKYHKMYGSEEFNHRYRVFSENMKIVEGLNAANDAGNAYGVTKFMDLSPSEFKSLYLRRDITPIDGPKASVSGVSRPDEFSWVKKGALNPIKDQGQCGSCWAFSTVSNIESMWFIKKGSLPNLSEQNLVDCDTLDYGCNGGLPSNAYQYVMLHGLDTESCYPYEAMNQQCKYTSSCSECKISSWQSITSDEDAMADWVYKNGPVSVALNAAWMQYYSGGVASPSSCDPSEIDHAVNIVGYGEDGKDYWLIRNSWGADWGENGYCRLVRGKGACGINLVVTSSIP